MGIQRFDIRRIVIWLGGLRRNCFWRIRIRRTGIRRNGRIPLLDRRTQCPSWYVVDDHWWLKGRLVVLPDLVDQNCNFKRNSCSDRYLVQWTRKMCCGWSVRNTTNDASQQFLRAKEGWCCEPWCHTKLNCSSSICCLRSNTQLSRPSTRLWQDGCDEVHLVGFNLVPLLCGRILGLAGRSFWECNPRKN